MNRKLLASIALAALTALTACSGLDSNTNDLPAPAAFAATDAVACGTAGSTVVVLDVVGVHVTENGPIVDPQGPDRVAVNGVVTGLAAGQSVYGLLIDDQVDCPIANWSELTAVAADGSFTLSVRAATMTGIFIENFRVIAVTGPAGATPTCSAAGDCIELSVGGAGQSVSGLSNAIGVRLL